MQLQLTDTSISKLRCDYPRRVIRAKPIGGTPADPIWDRLVQPKFKTPLTVRWNQPYGTAQPMSDEDTLADLIRTQAYDLPTMAQELMTNGIEATSLETLEGEDKNIPEESTKFTPYRFTTGDPEETSLLRRIAWEKYIHACGQSYHVWLAEREGQIYLATTDGRLKGSSSLEPFVNPLASITLTMQEIEENRLRAEHYKALVWAEMTPQEHATWRNSGYLDPASHETHDDWAAEEPPTGPILVDEDGFLYRGETGGPEELGLHELWSDDQTPDDYDDIPELEYDL